jgi:predicted nucleic acid binding AN1-type Zn finger protein
MGKCTNCRKRSHLGMMCKWCNLEHCVSCIQVEIHKCRSYDIVRDKQVLQDTLFSGKTIDHKNLKNI